VDPHHRGQRIGKPDPFLLHWGSGA
jgi:hypothetical protein